MGYILNSNSSGIEKCQDKIRKRERICFPLFCGTFGSVCFISSEIIRGWGYILSPNPTGIEKCQVKIRKRDNLFSIVLSLFLFSSEVIHLTNTDFKNPQIISVMTTHTVEVGFGGF